METMPWTITQYSATGVALTTITDDEFRSGAKTFSWEERLYGDKAINVRLLRSDGAVASYRVIVTKTYLGTFEARFFRSGGIGSGPSKRIALIRNVVYEKVVLKNALRRFEDILASFLNADAEAQATGYR